MVKKNHGTVESKQACYTTGTRLHNNIQPARVETDTTYNVAALCLATFFKKGLIELVRVRASLPHRSSDLESEHPPLGTSLLLPVCVSQKRWWVGINWRRRSPQALGEKRTEQVSDKMCTAEKKTKIHV